MPKPLYLYRGQLAGKVIAASDQEIDRAIAEDFGRPLGRLPYPKIERGPHAAADRFTQFYLDRQMTAAPRQGVGRVVSTPSPPSDKPASAPPADEPASADDKPAEPKRKPGRKPKAEPQEKGAA
jgi:hypothetical protein